MAAPTVSTGRVLVGLMFLIFVDTVQSKAVCPAGQVWFALQQNCISYQYGQKTNSFQTPKRMPTNYFRVTGNLSDAGFVTSQGNNNPFTTTDLFQSTTDTTLPPENQPFSTSDTPNPTPSQQIGPAIPVENPLQSIPSVNISNKNSSSRSKKSLPPQNIIIIYNSTGVAISQGDGAAVALSNSSNSGIGVGGAATTTIGGTTAHQTNQSNRTIIVIVNSTSVGVSTGTGAAVGISNSPLSGVGIGGAGISTINSNQTQSVQSSVIPSSQQT